MQISVNGRMRCVAEGTTVADLVRELGITAPRIAVEVDRQIVPKAEHGSTALAECSHVEIVTFVGGG